MIDKTNLYKKEHQENIFYFLFIFIVQLYKFHSEVYMIIWIVSCLGKWWYTYLQIVIYICVYSNAVQDNPVG